LLRIVALAVVPSALAGQDVAKQLDGRVSPDVRKAVVTIAADAAARGLPVEPLVEKAIEGGAKGVPADRVIAAVRALAGRLGDAMSALRAAGVAAPSGDVVEGGADALNAGLTGSDVRDLVRVSRPPYDPSLTLRVAATLVALGVPAQQALQLVNAMIAAGRSPGDLLTLPAEVQAGVGRGATPSQAAAGLARAAAAGRPPVPPGQAKTGKPANPHRP
jgi:rhodanese-related sulfurtransferase